MKFTATTVGMLLVLAMFMTAAADDKDKLGAQLVGSYTIASGEKFGEIIPAENLRESQVRITEREIIVTDKDDKRTYAASYKLDTTRQPWGISMVSIEPTKGQKAEGLIAIEEAKVRLIYALPDGEAPSSFKTGDRQLMFVLKSGQRVAGPEE